MKLLFVHSTNYSRVQYKIPRKVSCLEKPVCVHIQALRLQQKNLSIFLWEKIGNMNGRTTPRNWFWAWLYVIVWSWWQMCDFLFFYSAPLSQYVCTSHWLWNDRLMAHPSVHSFHKKCATIYLKTFGVSPSSIQGIVAAKMVLHFLFTHIRYCHRVDVSLPSFHLKGSENVIKGRFILLHLILFPPPANRQKIVKGNNFLCFWLSPVFLFP